MISVLVYRDHKFAAQNPPIESLATLRAEPNVMLWIDLSQPTDEETKQILEKLFGFHPLTIEDCVSDSPFPKLEPYDDYLYLVIHTLNTTSPAELRTAEIDIFLGKNYLVTYHREPLIPVDSTRDRFVKAPEVPVRGPDRLVHTLLDFVVEAYKPPMDVLRKQIEEIEERVLRDISAEELFPRVVTLRKQLSRLRQLVRPQREITAELISGDHKLVRSTIVPYLRDLGDELKRIETQTTAWSEQLIVSFRVFLNKSSHEANAGIRVLTAITALTFPALVVAGWYGMNFIHMHELSAPHGYPVAIVLTLVGTGAMLLFMRLRKWL
jgi:magnesium transporter